MKDKKGKTALLFGSFDPVHIGHLIIAEYYLNREEINEVWFVLTPHNPLKNSEVLSAGNHRLIMLKLALNNCKGYRVCDIEFSLSPPHYTYKTLLKLMEQYPDQEFILLIGSDNLAVFDQWRNYDEILSLLPVYVYPRVGFDTSIFDHYPNLQKTQAPIIEISSTMIRKNLASGLETRFLLPNNVYRYIVENKLYLSPNLDLSSST
jgi:nicotinate-nucleotide adenylyltransferase